MSNSFVSPWTIACQAPLSMGFPRQECWSGLPFPSTGDLPNPGSNPSLLHCRWFLYHLSHRNVKWSSNCKIVFQFLKWLNMRVTIWPNNSTPRFIQEKGKQPYIDFYVNFHSSIIDSSQKVRNNPDIHQLICELTNSFCFPP